MKLRTGIAGFFLLAASQCWAQAGTDYSGVWDVQWQENNLQLGAKLTIQGDTGTWQMFSQARRNACFSMAAPIELKRVADNRATIALKYSAALAGCADGMIHVGKLDGNTMTGKRGGVDMTFTRK